MLPTRESLLRERRITLYNNLGRCSGIEGRLLAELELATVPAIRWDFEVLGNVGRKLFTLMPELPADVTGHEFRLTPGGRHSWQQREHGPAHRVNGWATEAIYGDLAARSDHFAFYLPNGRFQRTMASPVKGERIEPWPGREDRFYKAGDGHFVELDLDERWRLSLSTSQEALAWLDPEARNSGSRLTTVGVLTSKSNAPEAATMSLSEARVRLERLADFLSFPNGGDLGPVYIVGRSRHSKHRQARDVDAAAVSAFATTPLDQIGTSWATHNSGITAYLRCFTTFERMLATPHWDQTVAATMNWYRQFTAHNPWPVAAVAVGAALERLSYTVLVEDEPDEGTRWRNGLLFAGGRNGGEERKREWGKLESPTVRRTQLLLERIGLPREDQEEAPGVLAIRNAAAHPVAKLPDHEELSRRVRLAMQWVEETLLWRVGYEGQYRDRAKNDGSSIQPRYDLSRRNPSW